ncbi:hypothetical protein VAS14_08925 [Vibrio angustum S14]|uniref:Uncharacterized protein n=1 Tax=Photobacterium angustum (strain S14 / CCUG 15956) TaxID=314292 RepID=Q1ZMV5_PHOAS|nr:hypothetical protein VAS14_08925 [Vibrio angustum S14] [Photobacterium angustum S14]
MKPYPKWKEEVGKLLCGALAKVIIGKLFMMF